MIIQRIIIFTILILALVSGEEIQDCNNPFEEKSHLLNSSNILTDIGDHCGFLKYGSCCTKEYLDKTIKDDYIKIREIVLEVL